MTVYVVDTSVLASGGRNALYSFGTQDLVIPMAVVKELEGLRNNQDVGLAATARSVLRELDRLQDNNDLKEWVSLGKGLGRVRVEVNHVNDVPVVLSNYAITTDIRIISVANGLSKETSDDVILVTKDITMKITASLAGVKSITLDDESTKGDKFLFDTPEFYINDEEFEEFHQNGRVRLDIDVPVNTGVILKGNTGGSGLAIAKTQFEFVKVKDVQTNSYVGRSKEQKILLHHLDDENVGVVSVSGTAGSGKSFLMLSKALELVRDNKTPYTKIVVFRPVNPVGGQHQDLGFLPGTMDEKLAPHIQAIYDTLGTVVHPMEVEKIKRSGIIEFASIAHVRGRTLANCIVILDELQNVEASTILTLLSRLGVNARVFVGWDIAQRDAQYIGKYDGIVKVVRKLNGNKLFAHVTLKKSERSAISEMVSGLLDEF